MNESLLPAQRLAIARNPQRPGITDYIDMLFTDFVELRETASAERTRRFWGALPCFTARPLR